MGTPERFHCMAHRIGPSDCARFAGSGEGYRLKEVANAERSDQRRETYQ